jgi:predicted acylesterase/phospholipase RssA
MRSIASICSGVAWRSCRNNLAKWLRDGGLIRNIPASRRTHQHPASAVPVENDDQPQFPCILPHLSAQLHDLSSWAAQLQTYQSVTGLFRTVAASISTPPSPHEL